MIKNNLPIISKDEIFEFENNGFLLIKNIISSSLIDSFQEAFFNLFSNLCGETIPCNWDDPIVHEKINKYRREDPLLIKKLYFTAKQIKSYQDLFRDNNLSNLLEQIFKVSSNYLIFSEYQFRFDVPLDTNYIHNWHQDSAYYPQDPYGRNSVVVNITIQDNTENMGIPNILVGSHKGGKLNFDDNTGINSKIMQLNVSSDYIDKTKIKIPETKKGDVILYHMNLIHKSGYNSSGKTRFSAISRVFNPLEKSYQGFFQSSKLLS